MVSRQQTTNDDADIVTLNLMKTALGRDGAPVLSDRCVRANAALLLHFDLDRIAAALEGLHEALSAGKGI